MTMDTSPSRQAVQAKTASRPGQVTGKLKEACRLMVEEGLTYQQAAAQAGLHVRSVYSALQRPHVLQALRRMREVFVERLCLENPSHLAELRGQRSNMNAAVRAIVELEAIKDEPHGRQSGMQTMPGLVVNIINTPSLPRPPMTIDVEPMPEPDPPDAA
jgi:hypothetical protein